MNWPAWQAADDFWRLDHPGRFPDELPALSELEREADLIIEYAPRYVPALLQITSYLRALLYTQLDLPASAVATVTAARQSRQRQLPTRNTSYLFYLHESVLHAVVGTPEITREQLTFLLLAQSTEAATIRIVPTASNFPTTPAFRLLHRNNAPPILHREHPNHTTFSQRSPDIHHHRSLTTHLNSAALAPTPSHDLIHHTTTP